MSVEYVSTMSLEYCVSYVPDRFRSTIGDLWKYEFLPIKHYLPARVQELSIDIGVMKFPMAQCIIMRQN